MNFMPSFVAWPFAVAGLIAATGPIVIHLLNRRRHRTVHWAAMDFLREAVKRNRRILQIRDLLLLALRTLAVLLIGLALARPFFSAGDEAFDGSEPLHAVLIIDNSLSMGYESLDGTSLDRAKQRARQFIDRLPADSRVTLVPLCGSRFGHSPDATSKAVALQSIDRIDIVDRSAGIRQVINQAVDASKADSSLAPRVVLFSDQQASIWQDTSGRLRPEGLPTIQVVDVAANQPENTWISDLRLQDGLADVETPATLIVAVRRQGAGARRDVQVRLRVDGVQVAAKTVSLEPGQGARDVAFQHRFDAFHPEPGSALAVPVTASIPADSLPHDDARCLVVPVVAGLPVVFVDPLGDGQENVIQNRIGETRHLRKLLAPATGRGESPRQLVQVRHIRLDQLDREVLEDARLVVIAGIADPKDRVPLLREYVEQGGQLVIAAGGDDNPANNGGFSPASWTSAAWLDGAGILPCPLAPEPLGGTLEEAGRGDLQPFYLAYDSLASHGIFQLAGVGEQELRDLYAEPLFFKAIRTNLESQTLQQLREGEIQRLEQWYNSPASETRLADDSNLTSDARWLLWNRPVLRDDGRLLPDDPLQRRRRIQDLASQTLPRVLATFDDRQDTAFLITRRIGQGDVLFVASGLLAEWNTLATTNAIVLFDRILRQMILSTLPVRNFEPAERIVLPMPTEDREDRVVLTRPGVQEREVLDTGFIGKSQYGFIIDQPLQRGIYRVAVERASSSESQATTQPSWETPLAVNGPAEESDLQPLAREEFERRLGDSGFRWIGPADEISLAGTQIRGQNSWWWMIVAALGLLGLELVILASISHWTGRTPLTAQQT